METVDYGESKVRKERELARASFEYIQRDVADIKNQYIRLGFHLNEMNQMGYYEDFGYKDFYEFCVKNCHMEKSAVSRCINVWKEFADYDATSHSHKMWIDEKYKEYNYSQLCELLSLPEKQRVKIKADMTVKQIRQMKKEWKDKKYEKPVATSQPENENDCGLEDREQKELFAEAEEIATSQPAGGTKEPEEPAFRPLEFLSMKNMEERERFVKDYKTWNVWCRNEKTEDIFYRYDLPDGAAIVARNYPLYVEWTKEETERYELYLLMPDYHHFMNCKSSMTEIKEYLKNMKKENQL